FQLHWTANGKPALDQAKLGLIFAKQTPREEIITLQAMNSRFEIPAGAENHRVDARVTLRTEATLELLAPHMHLRGKAFAMQVKLPDGELREILRVPRYDFNWQLSYVLSEPMRLPVGSQVLATGWFDNSANNKNNPDPSKAVRWGDQSWEEMMIGFFNVSVPVGTTYMDLMRPKQKQAAGPSSAGGLE
ncbi:MAG: thiol-disulfide isomerase, partial [Acidobacteriota bacterium]